jgi:hypothetical protein
VYDALSGGSFDMHAYVITAFGDIPAMSKLLTLKGHNGYSPCRFCMIRGERNKNGAKAPYYVPLRSPIRPGEAQDDGWYPRNLPMHTLDNLHTHLKGIKEGHNKPARRNLHKFYGVKKKSLLLRIPSLAFPSSFPIDIMHLFFENICPMLRDLWTCARKFKGKPPADDGDCLAPKVWEKIGLETAEAFRTIMRNALSAREVVYPQCKYSYFPPSWLKIVCNQIRTPSYGHLGHVGIVSHPMYAVNWHNIFLKSMAATGHRWSR